MNARNFLDKLLDPFGTKAVFIEDEEGNMYHVKKVQIDGDGDIIIKAGERAKF